MSKRKHLEQTSEADPREERKREPKRFETIFLLEKRFEDLIVFVWNVWWERKIGERVFVKKKKHGRILQSGVWLKTNWQLTCQQPKTKSQYSSFVSISVSVKSMVNFFYFLFFGFKKFIVHFNFNKMILARACFMYQVDFWINLVVILWIQEI